MVTGGVGGVDIGDGEGTGAVAFAGVAIKGGAAVCAIAAFGPSRKNAIVITAVKHGKKLTRPMPKLIGMALHVHSSSQHVKNS